MRLCRNFHNRKNSLFVGNARGGRTAAILAAGVLVLGFAAESIQREIDTQNVRVVINENYQQGMGTSLKAGLAAVDARADAAIIALADQPFVRPDTLNRLLTEHGRSKAQIVIPTYNGFRGNPVLLDRSVFPELMSLKCDIGCRAIFGGHTGNILREPVDDIGVLLDIDNPSDFENLQQAHARGGIGSALLESADLTGRDVSAGLRPGIRRAVK